MQYIIGVIVFALIDFAIVTVKYLRNRRKHNKRLAQLADEFDALGFVKTAAVIRRDNKIRK